jgi:hypothetical protein
MSATADAQLFADYMAAAPGVATAGAGGRARGQGREGPGGVRVGALSIPGFTFPVREFYLEVIGRGCAGGVPGEAPRAAPAAAARCCSGSRQPARQGLRGFSAAHRPHPHKWESACSALFLLG